MRTLLEPSSDTIKSYLRRVVMHRRVHTGSTRMQAIRSAPLRQLLSELVTDRTGASSPFGELVFPLPAEDLPYVHPVTVVNR